MNSQHTIYINKAGVVYESGVDYETQCVVVSRQGDTLLVKWFGGKVWNGRARPWRHMKARLLVYRVLSEKYMNRGRSTREIKVELLWEDDIETIRAAKPKVTECREPQKKPRR